MFTVASLGSPAAAATPKIAVLAFEQGPGVDERIASLITSSIAKAVQDRTGAEVISSREIAVALSFERQRQLMGCSGDSSSCAAELAGALGATLVVSGTVAKVGESFVMSAQLLDLSSAKTLHRYEQRVRGRSEEAFLDAVAPAAEALFPVSPEAGATRPRRHAALLVGGASVVLAAAGLTLGVLAYQSAAGAPASANYDGALQSANQLSSVANAAYIAAGLAAVAGAVLFLGGEGDATVGFAPAAGGFSFAIKGTF
jgi:TolB-like protein